MAEIFLPETGRPFAVMQAARGESAPDPTSQEFIALYREHGAVLLRGFDFSIDSFRVFAEGLCSSSVFNESPDRRLLDARHNIQSVNGGVDAFPLHPELSREPWKPDACLFCCLSAPAEGGETTVCDGVALVDNLPDEVRRGLEGRRLVYVQAAGPETLRYWLGTDQPDAHRLAHPPEGCPYRFLSVGGKIVRAFSRPALHRPMFTDRPAFGNFLLFARYYLKKPGFPMFEDGGRVPEAWMEAIRDAGETLTAPIAWRSGDLIVLDNTRFMHGRRAIKDAQGRLIASYFGYLRDARPDPEEPANAPWRKSAFRPPTAAPPR